MRILVAGGTGHIGTRVVRGLRDLGHEVRVAARSTGVDVISGVGLNDAMRGVDAVVDALNASQRTRVGAAGFFSIATGRMLEAEEAAGVDHHVTLSVVGADDLSADGYFVGKDVQERMIDWGHIPYTIVRSTQLLEFLPLLADRLTVDGSVRSPRLRVQPVGTEDTISALIEAVTHSDHVGGTIQIAGPKVYFLDELLRSVLRGRRDSREVFIDESSSAFGGASTDSLLPYGPYAVGAVSLDDYLRQVSVERG